LESRRLVTEQDEFAGGTRKLTTREECLALIAAGWSALYNGNVPQAEGAFQGASLLAKRAPNEERADLTALALCHLSVIRKRQGRTEDARRFRDEANPRLKDESPFMPVALFHYFMARALMELAEYRQAIPFWEQALVLKQEHSTPTSVADTLTRLGECFSRVGLKDHAVIPLRAAVRTFRKHAGDPRLSAALLTLGNALRKSQPSEAEACYREAADLHVGRGHFLSATPAWVNIAVLCSEQGRQAESIELCHKVLQIREKSPGVRPAQIATVWNNLANSYRRIGEFVEAHEAVARAIELLKEEGGAGLASAYGTEGLVYKDEGRDTEAVEWLRIAHDEHQKAPSPKLDSMVEDLENEIVCLEKLGRTGEVPAAKERLEAVRACMQAVPSPSPDIGGIDETPAYCALLVEVNFGNWSDSAQRKRECSELTYRLATVLEDKGVGFLGGSATIPESTTLIFYGSDAETLFQTLLPTLSSEPLCSGARITIRQQDGFREVVLPSWVN
jgi:tetratricopeptide (TPR) repeat protein